MTYLSLPSGANKSQIVENLSHRLIKELETEFLEERQSAHLAAPCTTLEFMCLYVMSWVPIHLGSHYVHPWSPSRCVLLFPSFSLLRQGNFDGLEQFFEVLPSAKKSANGKKNEENCGW